MWVNFFPLSKRNGKELVELLTGIVELLQSFLQPFPSLSPHKLPSYPDCYKGNMLLANFTDSTSQR